MAKAVPDAACRFFSEEILSALNDCGFFLKVEGTGSKARLVASRGRCDVGSSGSAPGSRRWRRGGLTHRQASAFCDDLEGIVDDREYQQCSA
ncbi:MAG: hypothetical protein M2R45_04956 [Verrucomicrobia subdivision 3 bacterium]|nr:hypothetical protein [Limisphaerales bacterium]MCS1415607.1 hypothetical protein [Limisphaerales bacterium]